MSNPADPSSRWEEGCTSTSARSASPPPDGTAAERLTDDLLVDILSRVPAKSLCRFMCVSNHWMSLIEHLDHRKGLPQTMSGFFYGRTITDDYEWLPGSPVHFTGAPGRRCPPIDTSCAFLPSHRRVDLLDCCNGLLLCRWYGLSAEVGEFHYVVCNPATEKWVLLPDSGQATSKVAITRLGFNPNLSSHFHVFELLQNSSWDGMTRVEVYSSETGKWVHKRKVRNERISLTDPKLATAFLNGYLHFLTFGRELSQHCVAAVDKEGATWRKFRVPGGLSGGLIQQSQGCLHYANFQRDRGGAVVRLVVYVLEDYDSKKWILKHSVETSCIFGDISVRLYRDFDLIAIHPDCNLIFFAAGWTKFICYNTESRQVEVFCNREDGRPPFLPYVPLYSELHSLP